MCCECKTLLLKTPFLQELQHSGRDLDQFYEESKKGTFYFKDRYDDIKKTEQLTEALRQTYYVALSEKKKHEEDRDNYFKVTLFRLA